jgi:GNAT superfamily N-acetyltransferase
MALTVRSSTAADARAIATVRVQTWRIAYAHLLDAGLLRRLDVEREALLRAARWDENHADPRRYELVAERDGAVVGWASGGPGREGDLPDAGELYAIYALPHAWSTGVGRALLLASEVRLHRAGYRRAFLWHLAGNARAAAFYERNGWVEDGASKVDGRLSVAAPVRERRRVRQLGRGSAERSPSAGGADGDLGPQG